MATWRNEIAECMGKHGESWDDVVSTTLSTEEMGAGFDAGFGAIEGVPFTLWTTDRVYFPATYDGSEWVESVPRNPSQETTRHIGE